MEGPFDTFTVLDGGTDARSGSASQVPTVPVQPASVYTDGDGVCPE